VLRNFNLYFAVVGDVGLMPDINGVNAKALTVDTSTRIPTVRVRVASGWHGALPLTAGAELVMAARYVGLDEVLGGGFVRTGSGDIEELPSFHEGNDEFELIFPERRVESVCLTEPRYAVL
jgi:hypothetical protein